MERVRFADRGLALERLGRHFKLFTDRIELPDTNQIIERLRQGRARVAARARGTFGA